MAQVNLPTAVALCTGHVICNNNPLEALISHLPLDFSRGKIACKGRRYLTNIHCLAQNIAFEVSIMELIVSCP